MSLALWVEIVAALIISLGDIEYLRGIVNRKVRPMKSTWIIFTVMWAVMTGSFFSDRFDIVNGILFLSNLVFFVLILIATFIWSREKTKFTKLDKGYLLGVGICIVIWSIASPFWGNLIAQVTFSIGYVLMIHDFLKNKDSSGESIFSWSCWTLGSLIAIYPALVEQNNLAIIFSLRSLVLCGLILFFVFLYQKKDG